MNRCEIRQGDSLTVLKTLDAESVHCVVTSPPYWGLRDYGIEGQLGLEKTPEEYVQKMVQLFGEVRRVLRDDGTLWLNLGDSYAGTRGNSGEKKGCDNKAASGGADLNYNYDRLVSGLKPKDLCGIPWRVAFALQAEGWYLRSDIIWSKPNPMPESVKDRPTKAHEYLFLMAKSERYYYDAKAICEPAIYRDDERPFGKAGGNRHGDEGSIYKPVYKDARSYDGKHTDKQRGHGRRHAGFNDRWDKMEKLDQCSAMRNKRSVWTIATSPFPEAHFATFPEKLISPCILAGAPPHGTVLDPFAGAGTTGLVAIKLGRNFLGIELNPKYIEMAKNRIRSEAGLLASMVA